MERRLRHLIEYRGARLPLLRLLEPQQNARDLTPASVRLAEHELDASADKALKVSGGEAQRPSRARRVDRDRGLAGDGGPQRVAQRGGRAAQSAGGQGAVRRLDPASEGACLLWPVLKEIKPGMAWVPARPKRLGGRS